MIIQLFEFYPVLFLVVAIIVGLVIGSFLNVVIYRLPKIMASAWRAECEEFLRAESAAGTANSNGETQGKATKADASINFNLAFPSSHCPKCNADIKPWQNIPVVSYILLRGACSQCKEKISPRYPIIELVTAVLTTLVAYLLGASAGALLGIILTWCLIVLTMIDIDHQLLPDSITLPLLWLGLLVNSFGVFANLESAVFGAMAGYLSLWSVYWLFKLITGKEGMGYGDFKLLAALGAWMGWQALPLIIILSSFVGAAIGIAGILIAGRDKNIPIPFGPYIAIAGWIAFLWGDQITGQYLQIAGITP